MANLHLPGTREDATQWNFPLGIPGFRFADLNRVRRLMQLDALFLEDLSQKDAALAQRLKELRETQGEGCDPAELSAVLINAAKHLGPFIARIFHIEADAEQMNTRTRETGV